LDALLDDVPNNRHYLNAAVQSLLFSSNEVTDWDRHIANYLLSLKAYDHCLQFVHHTLSLSIDPADINTTLEVLLECKQYNEIHSYIKSFYKEVNKELTLEYKNILKQLFVFLIEKHNKPTILLKYTFSELENVELLKYLESMKVEEVLFSFHIKRKNYAKAMEVYENMPQNKKVNFILN